jgi:precorrin-2 dehydrogenase/sirohydrochlorin ferrochelatase
MHTRYYPLFVSLHERVCLVVGGGSVAERKIRTLQSHGASIRVVAPSLTAWLKAQLELNRIDHLGTGYESSHLNGVDLVFVATDNLALNQQVAADAQIRRIWCNMATDPHLGSFVVPAVVERGPLSIAISTAGVSPAAARRIREDLEQQFGPEWGPYLVLLGSIRTAIQRKQLGTEENQRLFKEIAQLPLLDWLRDGQREPALQTLRELCKPSLTDNELATFWKEACAQYSS